MIVGLVVSALYASSRILGFFRDMILASRFGTSSLADAIAVGSIIPSLLSSILGVAFSTAIVPSLAKKRASDGAVASHGLFFGVLGAYCGILSLLSLVVMVWPAPVIRLLAPNLPLSTSMQAVQIERIVMPSMVLSVAALMIRGALVLDGDAITPAIGPVAQNLTMILGLFLLPLSPSGIGWTILMGSAFYLISQVPSVLRRFGFPTVNNLPTLPDLKWASLSSVPILFATVLGQSFAFAERIASSGLSVGTISALSYADKLRQLPVGILAMTIWSMYFPKMARAASKGDKPELIEQLVSGIRVLGIFSLPMSTLLFGLAHPIVVLLFQRGSFTADSTLATETALQAYSFSTFSLCAITFLSSFYYSVGRTFVPVVANGLALLVNVGVILVFVRPFGHVGVAAANSIASMVGLAYLVFKLSAELNPRVTSRILGEFLRILVASTWALLPTWLITRTWTSPQTAVPLILWLSVMSLCYLSLFMVGAHKLGVPEVRSLVTTILLRTKVRKISR